ncbi:MAG: leucine-rich repeat domain-containing protein [Proteobacteria bacterium]|nr:leucine-rich repeat domain-containing protein [Pseudomonadota bacterium]
MELTRDNCLYVFRYYKNVNRVQINNERIESIAPFHFFNQLIELEFKNNNISDLSAISGMKNLRKLSLSRNQIRSVTGLSQLDNLRDLDLSNNQIDDFSQLVGPQLERLNLSGNFIGENLGKFPKLPSLTVLDLSKNQIGRLDGLVLTNTPALKDLRLAHNAIVNIGRVEQFAGLVILDLSENSLYSAKGLAEVSDIDDLNLSGNKISSLELVDLPRSLTSLNISNNPLKSVIIDPNGQASLKVFVAKGTGLDSLSFLAGASFSSLESLDVASNKISVLSVPESVAAKLRVLNVSDNQLANLDGIRKFPYLNYLNLAGNRALYEFGAAVGDLRNIVGQRFFDLGYLYDLENLVVSDRGTSGLTTCGNGVVICPLMYLVNPHKNHLGQTIALKMHFESTRN